MADDFLNFTSGDAPAAPAAAAQDDFLGGGAAPAAPQDDFFGGAPAAQPAAAEADFLSSEQAAPPQAPQDDFMGGESQAQPPADSSAPAVDIMADNDASPPPPPQPVEIPPLVKWEIANREAMAAKDGVAMENDSKIKKDAGEVVSQFYNERKDLISANHDRNSGAESEFCKQRDALFATGQVWERVVSLIDVKASNEKKPTKVSRMRQLLLHMKNEAK